MTMYLFPETLPDIPLRTLFTAVIVCLVLFYPAKMRAQDSGGRAATALVNVYSDGDAGYPRFRIPVLLALEKGTLLAFAEGRRPTFPGQHDDHAQNNIVLRRSVDGGKTWAPVQVIAAMGGDSLNDPCAVVLPDSGRVLLMYQRFPQGYHARKMEHTEMAERGYDGPRNTQTFLIYSDDAGATWSAPRDITHSVRAEDAISIGSPGIGIVLAHGPHAGRILLPLYEVIPRETDEGQERYWRNRAAISDDQGATWRLGERVPIGTLGGDGNECQLVELAHGDVRMHARLQSDANRVARTVSQDGGETWAPLAIEPALVATPCMTSLIAHPGTKEDDQWLVVSLPHSEADREKGTLLLSRDNGETWPHQHMLYPGGFAYSSLAVLPDGNLGCLFERGPYEHLTYTTVDMKTLLPHYVPTQCVPQTR